MTLEKFKDLFDTLYPSLCLFANKYVNNSDLVKDIVQEVYIKIWEQKKSYPSHNAIKAFLYTSVKNKCLDHLRSKYHRVMVNTTNVDVKQIQTEEHFLSEMATVDIYTNLERAIKALPEKCEQVIRFSLRSYSNKEIAEELSVTINTVKTQKRIAYQKLRNALNHLNNILNIF